MSRFFKKVVALAPPTYVVEAEVKQNEMAVSNAPVAVNEADDGVEDVSLSSNLEEPSSEEEVEASEEEEEVEASEEEEEVDDEEAIEHRENKTLDSSETGSSVESDEEDENNEDNSVMEAGATAAAVDQPIQKSSNDLITSPETPPYSKRSNSSLTEIEEEQLLQSIIQKKLGFFPLKDWEEDREAHYIAFVMHTEPIYNDILATTNRALSVCTQAIVLFGHVSKILTEMTERLGRLTNIQFHVENPLVEDSAHPAVVASSSPTSAETPAVDEAIPEASTEATAVSSPRIEGDTTKEGGVKPSPLRVAAGKWMSLPKPSENSLFEERQDHEFLLEIMQLFYKGSSEWHNTSSWIVKELVSDKLETLKTEYDSKMKLILNSLSQMRASLFKNAEKCRADWNEYELIFKEIERTEVHRSGVRKCSWLNERKYRFSAKYVEEIQRNYFKELINTVIKVQQFEQWRNKCLQEYLNLFISTASATISSSASLAAALVDAHRDEKSPDALPSSTRSSSNHRSLKVPSLGLMNSSESPTDVALTGGISSRSANVTFKYLSDPNGAPIPVESVEKPTGNDGLHQNSPGFKVLMELLTELEWPDMENLPAFLSNVDFSISLNQLGNVDAPKSSLVIKTGPAERLTGLKPFSKWSASMIVLTWDRFLHFFKDFSELSPLHSVNLASMVMKTSEMKGIGEAVGVLIDLREKGWSFIAPGRGSAFKISDAGEAEDWITRLKDGFYYAKAHTPTHVATNAKNFLSVSSEQFRHDVEGDEQVHPYFPSRDSVHPEELEAAPRSSQEGPQVASLTKGETATKGLNENVGGSGGHVSSHSLIGNNAIKNRIQNLTLGAHSGKGKKMTDKSAAHEKETVQVNAASGEGEEEEASNITGRVPPTYTSDEENSSTETSEEDEADEQYVDSTEDTMGLRLGEGTVGITEEPMLPATTSINPFGDEDD
ncbi:hypothetical protein IE077_001131 [Cardiosporidium cionae]|uniref:PH domain-containing protein n=1 Tax=Cardiosporidium cionae TaxID=476202 RepID=A0ABQ7J5V5_9APIC|nr:hypothetical protein IE077_001131 [Cardiosporidium cionae]|eukprot:KAF8819366.1 hypothetical protein IE077_001131 [Cardiosporidium cionae]